MRVFPTRPDNPTTFTTKTASFDNADDTQFEKIFSSLAFNEVRSTAPKLLDYLVGFQQIERNSEGTKAFGVLGFRVGTDWLYVPSIFDNNGIFGPEMIFSSRMNSITPLGDRWVDFLLGSINESDGDAVFDPAEKMHFSQPSIQGFSESFRSSRRSPKLASDLAELHDIASYNSEAGDDFGPGIPMFAALLTKQAAFLFGREGYGQTFDSQKIASAPLLKPTGLCGMPDIEDLATASPHAAEWLEKAAADFPEMQAGLNQFYGPDFLQRVKAGHHSLLSKSAADTSERDAEYRQKNSPVGIDKPKVQIFTSETMEEMPTGNLGLHAREEVRETGKYIKDDRDATETSDVYPSNASVGLDNPTETGTYKVLTAGGGFLEAFVSLRPFSPGRTSPDALVMWGDGKKYRYLTSPVNDIFVENRSIMSTYPKVWDEARKKEVKKLKPDHHYVIITKDCEISSPFRVNLSLGNDVYDVRFDMQESGSRSYNFPEPGQSMHSTSMEREHTEDNPTVQLNSKYQPYTEIAYVDNRVVVPQEGVVVELDTRSSDRDSCMPICSSHDNIHSDEKNTIALGTLSDVQHALMGKFASFNIQEHDSTFIVDGDAGCFAYPKKEAQYKLMVDHGLTKHAAGVMLKKAKSTQNGIHEFSLEYGSSAGVLKEASALQALVGGNSTANANFDNLDRESSVELGGNRSLSIMEDEQEAQPTEDPELSGYSEFEQYDAWHNYEPGDFQDKVQTANSAIADGDKTLFDVTSLTAMLGSVKTDRSIDDYLKSLFKGVDSLGRLLLNFYWHKEDFEERYGKSELPELGDALQNAFESLGEVVLFLKEKSLEQNGDLFDLSVDQVANS